MACLFNDSSTTELSSGTQRLALYWQCPSTRRRSPRIAFSWMGQTIWYVILCVLRIDAEKMKAKLSTSRFWTSRCWSSLIWKLLKTFWTSAVQFTQTDRASFYSLTCATCSFHILYDSLFIHSGWDGTVHQLISDSESFYNRDNVPVIIIGFFQWSSFS